jgi:hypothetical protein
LCGGLGHRTNHRIQSGAIAAARYDTNSFAHVSLLSTSPEFDDPTNSPMA